MWNNPRRDLTPGASRKRKEREGFDALKASIVTPTQAADKPNNNRLLAGYLAHEFLTQGTLFGQRWDPARAGAAPVGAEPKKTSHISPRADPRPASSSPIIKPAKAYADVAHLINNDAGAHIPGIVNPTQLARWLQM
ncbi:uncharacterized protein LOC143891255 [Tasmannia lanceolata]|uniref:uncharacterized protein LOC143891255 n=1 Tax=Tasmannia lanceolata TaxID=3420 RepID=UPI00406381E6